jgi:hypothetical protein
MKNLLIPLLLISLSACGSSNSSSNGNPSTLPAPVPSTSPNPQPTDNGATEEQALTGTWTTSCEISSPFYQTKTFSYTSTASSFIYNYYSDSLCTNLIQTLNLSGNTLVEQSPTDSSINFADINSVTVELTIQDPATVNSYNTSNECGFNNWQINQSQDVAGLTCSGFDFTFPTVGSFLYTIYQIQSTNLFFGDPSTGDGSSEETRPSSLNLDEAWINQP